MIRPVLSKVQPMRMAVAPRRLLNMKPTARQLRPMPKEEHSAHTVSQRLRLLKKIPAELIPLGVVIGFALVIAAYSSARKFFTDRTLRLQRRGPQGDH